MLHFNTEYAPIIFSRAVTQARRGNRYFEIFVEELGLTDSYEQLSPAILELNNTGFIRIIREDSLTLKIDILDDIQDIYN